ncbi:MAG: pantetheine-phosphate adenylyltransferase [Dysgonamonadaceae bacterium]|jgi:pantetheine-phosphate adenylyltransferase|nr:pantetheine-phosphate adenylyltransferase [Dysgonamonadaceae bacterium]
MKKIAIFPGTFDPITIGHVSVIERALNVFDEIVIAIGVNRNKKTFFPLEKRVEMIASLFEDNNKVRVGSYSGLTVDFARAQGARFILRGIRSVNDFEYEKNIADVNRQISDIDTFILFTEPEHAHVSSSIVRELLSYGKDVAPFVPQKLKIQ